MAAFCGGGIASLAAVRAASFLVLRWVGTVDGFVGNDILRDDLLFCVQQGFFQDFAGKDAFALVVEINGLALLRTMPW